MSGIKTAYPFIEFYLSLVAYFILHMIFVIASDFVEAFNIPPLNIGIYVDKLAAIRALLMVLSDFVEWGITQKWLGDGGNANQSLLGDTNEQKWFEEWKVRKNGWHNGFGSGPGSRRWASIISFVGMLICRCVYLYLLYKSDNKSLSVFITLCLEGFWFGLFQMGFFAIGPEYNAYTSFGIHTMGNIIFFLQVILQYYAKKKPKINCLYRVRVHAWIVVITSIIALILWICFCLWANAGAGGSTSEWPSSNDVWSPFLLFIVGAFAEDFAVPGVLPFAFLDPEKANLVNYLTPSFFMTGALVTVIFNDWWTNINYKAWSCSSPETEGMKWHALWLLNIPKYIAFFIAMWSIHGTFADLRCIIQSRWRVMWLTLTVVVPRAVLETSGYVGVANWSIGRGDPKLAATAALIEKLKNPGSINGTNSLNATQLRNAINGESDSEKKVKKALAAVVKEFHGAEVADTTDKTKDISASGSSNPVTVTIGGTSGSKKFNDLVQKLKENGNITEMGEQTSAESVAGKIKEALKESQKVNPALLEMIKSMVDSGKASKVSKVTVDGDSTTVNVKINDKDGNLGSQATVDVTITGTSPQKQNIQIHVKGEKNEGFTEHEGTAIAKALALAIGHSEVKTAAKIPSSTITEMTAKDTSTIDGTAVTVTTSVNLQVNLHRSLVPGTENEKNEKNVAENIAKKIKEAVEQTDNPSKTDRGAYEYLGAGGADFGAFDYIAWHDVTAMFCRFVYGKFAVGYN